MAQVLVRDLDEAVVEQLKARAAGNDRSLEAELRAILTAASAQVDWATARAEAEEMRQRLEGRPFPDAGALISEERQR